jgi:hypothetical protein
MTTTYATFLFFVCWTLLGRPAYGSCWHCLWCDRKRKKKRATLSVLKPRQRADGTWHDIKFKCHNPHCDQYGPGGFIGPDGKRFGDEHDLLRKLYPGVSSETIACKLKELLQKYEEYKAYAEAEEQPTFTHVGREKGTPSSPARRGKTISGEQAAAVLRARRAAKAAEALLIAQRGNVGHVSDNGKKQ